MVCQIVRVLRGAMFGQVAGAGIQRSVCDTNLPGYQCFAVHGGGANGDVDAIACHVCQSVIGQHLDVQARVFFIERRQAGLSSDLRRSPLHLTAQA